MEWPAFEYETCPWERSPEMLALVPKSRRRKIGSEYEAAVPPMIASLDVELSSGLVERLALLLAEMARFDARMAACGYNLPASLLRSESSASSQIENLTSSVRNVALAELNSDAPSNAVLIAGNVAAMRSALEIPIDCTVDSLREVHKALVQTSGQSFGGELREEQVWIGGTPYSPHGANYVAPQWERVPAYLEDLCAFCERDDINPVAQAAIAHAQFENIHPFIDGNGRCGRALIHRQLAFNGALLCGGLPISAGLLHDSNSYFAALSAYREGNVQAIVEELAAAIEIALSIGAVATSRIEDLLDSWHELIEERKSSAIHRLPELLVEQPVVDAEFVADKLGISDRMARNVLARASEYGIVRQLGSARRNRFFQADELLEILEDVSAKDAVRRILS